jgi:3',5'-cyclic AMP phosphodiesterase CpdA
MDDRVTLFKSVILQVGDVHFPEWKAAASDIDLKVSEFSERIVSQMQIDPLTTILGGLRDVCRNEPIDVALLMGDITSQGKVEYLPNAVATLSGLINDSDADRQIPIYGVPGNHDVSKDDAVNLGEVGKFRPLERAYQSVNWAMPPVLNYIKQRLRPEDGDEIPIYLLNSSIGSWSKALFPDGLRELVFADDPNPIRIGDTTPFEDLATKREPARTRTEQVYEQLDTPYFRAVDMQAIAEDIEQHKNLAVVVAHHNILPQYLPRVSHFGEVLNAGYARQLLLATGAKVLYLHGHIHTDPIEIVSVPDDDGAIISIAAPVLWKGFNVITVFQHAGGTPFAVKIIEHRIESGRFQKRSKLVPLTSDKAELLKKGVSKFWNYLIHESGHPGEVYNWGEIISYGTKTNLSGDELETTVLALYCARLIKIHNFGGPVNSWRITIRG